MTFVSQPLDVSMNKPMEVLLEQKWNNWYTSDSRSFKATGRKRKPELLGICKLIIETWAVLRLPIIVKALKKMLISNKIGSTVIDII